MSHKYPGRGGSTCLFDLDLWKPLMPDYTEDCIGMHPIPREPVNLELLVKTWENVPIIADYSYRWYPFGFSRKDFRKNYLLPAVRHYKVKRE